MFASHEAELNVSFPVARDRLSGLTSGGWLSNASEQAYADGLAGLIRVGPFGDVLGVSKLVRVSLLEPVPRPDEVVLPLRWEATGVAGRLFPVLDANLLLCRREGERSQLVLTGAYRPPLGSLGASLDRVLLHRAATATVRSLLNRVAGSIAAPGAGASPATVPPKT
jgi:hypothetical protein